MKGRDRYKVNEIFYSLQGEGLRAGTPNVFLRFSACNLQCNAERHGFDCDTDFDAGDYFTGEALFGAVEEVGRGCRNVIFTGGEPALQVDDWLVSRFRKAGWHTAIETNGTRPLPGGIDWVCVSPKPPDDDLRVDYADELKYVIAKGMPIPQPPDELVTPLTALLLSPAHQLNDLLHRDDLNHCIELVKENPAWRLSVQQHKAWRVR